MFRYYGEDRDRPQITWPLIKRVGGYAQPYFPRILLLIALIILTSGTSLIQPLLLRDLLGNALPKRDTVRLNWLALGLFGLPLLAGLLQVGQGYLSAFVGENIICNLRQAVYGHLQRMSMRFFTHTKTGEMMSRLNNDVRGAQRAVTGTAMNLVDQVISLVGTLIVMLSLEWQLTLLGILILPLLALPARRMARVLPEVIRRQMDLRAKMSALMNETLNVSGALLVKIFGRVDDESAQFGKAAREVRDISLKSAVIGCWYFMATGLVGALDTALVFWVGGHLVLQGSACADPRRGDQSPGVGKRSSDPAGARTGDARPHQPGDRPPPEHGALGRPDPGYRPWAVGAAGHTPGTAGPGRAVPRSVRKAISCGNNGVNLAGVWLERLNYRRAGRRPGMVSPLSHLVHSPGPDHRAQMKTPIVRNAIKRDLLFFALPATFIYIAGLVVSARHLIGQQEELYIRSVQNVAGLALIVIGLTLELVAAFTLGRSYSSTLVLRKGHRLITHGVYRFTRHPIYLGVIMVCIGVPLYASSLYGLLTMSALIPLLLIRIGIEEQMLIDEFGEAYRAYQETTSKLIPFIC